MSEAFRQLLKQQLEVISVGGKGLFDAYSKILRASDIEYSIIADRDYVEQIGGATIKSLFTVDADEIKKDVVDNVKSFDGDALVRGIESAMTTGSWRQAQDVWDYITCAAATRLCAPRLRRTRFSFTQW